MNPSGLCFRKLLVAKKLWIRGGGSITIFRGNFLFYSAEKFCKGALSCCSNFGYRKSLDKKGVEYQHFPSKIFCLAVPKVFVGESFTVAVFLGTGKVWIRKGWSINYFRRKYLSHSAENNRR